MVNWQRTGLLWVLLSALCYGTFTGLPLAFSLDHPHQKVSGLPLDLKVDKLLKLADSFGSDYDANDAYERVLDCFFQGSAPGATLTAFEENRWFIYALGPINGKDVRGSSEGAKERGGNRAMRRLLFLKPSTFLIQETDSDGAGPEETQSLPADSERELTVQDISHGSPQSLIGSDVKGPGTMRNPKTNGHDALPTLRLVLVHLRQRGSDSIATAQTTTQDGDIQAIVATDQSLFKISLPTDFEGSPQLAVSRLDGKILLERRPLPVGVLPHGVKGMRLLEEWDKGYRGNRPPLWDAGRPSRELTKLVASGSIRPASTLELGCGSGTDAIYLAGLGFEVTAIDIAPSALRIAQQKAKDAGVNVRWLLADVLAAPNLGPFDFIYDRGCYHEVRGHGLSSYLATLARVSRPSSRFLLLAGNANDPEVDYGPPRVTESDLRADFSKLFEFEWLRESRFEIAEPGAREPLAWAALLRRRP